MNGSIEKLIVSLARQLWHRKKSFVCGGGQGGGYRGVQHRRGHLLSFCTRWVALTFPQARLLKSVASYCQRGHLLGPYSAILFLTTCAAEADCTGVHWIHWMTACFLINVFSVQAPDSGQERRSCLQSDPAPLHHPLHPSPSSISTPTSLFIPCHHHNTSHLCDVQLETCNFHKVCPVL